MPPVATKDALATKTGLLLHQLRHFAEEHVPGRAQEVVADVQKWVVGWFGFGGGAAAAWKNHDTDETIQVPIFLALARIAQLSFVRNAHGLFAGCVWAPQKIVEHVCGNDVWQCMGRSTLATANPYLLPPATALEFLRDQLAGERSGTSTSATSRSMKPGCLGVTALAFLSLGRPFPWQLFLISGGVPSANEKVKEEVQVEPLPLLPPLLHAMDQMSLLDQTGTGTSSVVRLLLQPPGFVDSENEFFELRTPTDLRIAVFPERELVSDFLRARRVPYCNGGVLKAVENYFDGGGADSDLEVDQMQSPKFAPTSTSKNRENLHLVEVGANLGDCLLFLLHRHRSWTGQAVEAVFQTALKLRESVEINGLHDRLEVIGGKAVSNLKSKPLFLKNKPFSLNSASFVGLGVELADRERLHADVPEEGEDLHRGRHVIDTIQLRDGFYFPRRIDALLVNTNGHELAVLRSLEEVEEGGEEAGSGGADSCLPELIVLQMYTREHGVAQDPAYDAVEIFRWLLYRGYEMRLCQRGTGDAVAQGRGHGNVIYDNIRDFSHALQHVFSPVFDLVAVKVKNEKGRKVPSPLQRGLREFNALMSAGGPVEGAGSQGAPIFPTVTTSAADYSSSWVEVSKTSLLENWRSLIEIVGTILRRSGGGGETQTQRPEIGVVLKSNAYGHGVAEVVRAFMSMTSSETTEEARPRTFYVDSLQDAFTVVEVLREQLQRPRNINEAHAHAQQDHRDPLEDEDFEVVLLYRAPSDLELLGEIANAGISLLVLSVSWWEQLVKALKLFPPANTQPQQKNKPL
eukprot:g18433.t1